MPRTFSPEDLVAAYDYLRSTLPFRRWKLPESDALEFRVTQHADRHGHFDDRDGVPGKWMVIAISSVHTMDYRQLLATMAHELIHLKSAVDGKLLGEDDSEHHDDEFKRLAKQVCVHHGFAKKTF